MAPSIPQKLQAILDSFVIALKDLYADDLVSVFIYGSAASGEFSKKNSNINIAVILRDASLKNLSKLSPVLRQYRFRLLDPVFFSEDYLSRSLDVFPVEFLDMKENYSPVYGKDILKGISVETKNLRFQCEQELKAKLINIKRAYLRTPASAGRRELLLRSATSCLHIMRNLLRIKGQTPPYAKHDIIDCLERTFGIKMGAFVKALKLKGGQIRLSGSELEDLFFEFSEALEDLVSLADTL